MWTNVEYKRLGNDRKWKKCKSSATFTLIHAPGSAGAAASSYELAVGDHVHQSNDVTLSLTCKPFQQQKSGAGPKLSAPNNNTLHFITPTHDSPVKEFSGKRPAARLPLKTPSQHMRTCMYLPNTPELMLAQTNAQRNLSRMRTCSTRCRSSPEIVPPINPRFHRSGRLHASGQSIA